MNGNEILRRVCDMIENKREEITQTLKVLVQIPTISGREGEGQKHMQRLYSDLGLQVTAFEPDHDKISRNVAFVDSGWELKGRPNIVGILNGEPSARSLILNGHVDVVTPEPLADWKFDPWGGEVVKGKLYGRGAMDMKGGLIANCFALKSLLEAGLRPRGTVMLQSVIEEEAGGHAGSLACFFKGFTADGLVISEPTMKIIVVTPGIYYFRVRVIGKSAHGGMAHTGVNAIVKMNQICQALVELDEKRAQEKHHPLFEIDSNRSCHLHIGTYKAGDLPSKVAGWAEINCRISTIPGEKADEVKNQVHQVINSAANQDEWLREHPPEITWLGLGADPWEQDFNDPFVVAFKSCADKVLGTEVDFAGATWGLDTRFAKKFNMPALTFGPEGENIHGANEYVDLDSLIDCTKVLASFIIEWCGVQD